MIRIEISDLAKITFQEVSAFIYFLWSKKVLQDFVDIVSNTKNLLLTNPYLGKPYSKNIRKIILHKNASMYYEYDEENKIITILLFNDNRQNPESYLKLI